MGDALTAPEKPPNPGKTHFVGDDCKPDGHRGDPGETESRPADKTPADLLAAAHEAVAEANALIGQNGWSDAVLKAHAAIDRAVEGLLRRCCAMEKQALSKRDAEWREAAKLSCDDGGQEESDFCGACRTVARMERKDHS
jgi:hypothetical protein